MRKVFAAILTLTMLLLCAVPAAASVPKGTDARYETAATETTAEQQQQGFAIKNSTIIGTALVIAAICLTVMLITALTTKKDHPSDKKWEEHWKK